MRINRKIFKPFVTNKSTSMETGLRVSYYIVKVYDGETLVTSEINKETVFTITLPV